jgi:hypothetical protein
VLVRALIIVPALVVVAARVARADAPARPQLEVSPSCARVDAAQLRRLLDIEAGRDERTGQARVDVSCQAGMASLSVQRSGDAESERVRSFTERDVAGEIGARVLSLAVIELLNESPATRPPPVSEAEPKLEPEPKPERAKPPPQPKVRLMLAGSASTFGFEQALVGGGISVDFLRLSKLGLRIELGMGLGSRRYDLGEARVQLTSMAAELGYLAVHESWSARAMLGYRFGSGRISGEAQGGARQGTVSGACGGPLIAGGLGWRSDSFVAELSTEAGLVSFPLEGRVEGNAPIQLDGYWVGLSLSVGTLL